MKNFIFILILFCTSLYSQVSEVWIQNYNGTANGTDQAITTIMDNSGNLYVSGISSGTGTGQDIVTIKYNSESGDTMWVNRYAGISSDQVNAITCDNSAVYVTGWSFTPSRDIITIKYDASNGNILWFKTYNGTGNGGDYGFAIAVDGSGNVYVTGRSDIGGAQKFTTLKYDAFGNISAGWPNIYSGPLSTTFDQAQAIKVDVSGNVFVTGKSGITGTENFLTIKINSSGTIVWGKKYNGNLNSEDNALTIVLDNSSQNVYVGGYSIRTGNSYDYCLIKYAATNGDSLAGAFYNGPVSNHDLLKNMTIDNSGNVYVTGTSWGYGGGGYDYATIKYDSDCIQQWVARYNGTGNYADSPNSICVDGLGNVYVTGFSLGIAGNDDYATVSYNSAGLQQWVQRYNGTGNGTDAASSIAVNGSGNVFVTGWTTGIGTYDYTTIKYSQLPAAPSGLTALADSSRNIQLTWSDNSNNEAGYKVERSTNGGNNWNIITSLGQNTNSFLDTGLIPNSVYYYRVFGYNIFGNSQYSNIAYDTVISVNSIDNINSLILIVSSLKNSGILNQGQANSLIVKLNTAVNKIQEGKINTAINQLNAFINQVNGFINAKILTNQQGQQLISITNNIILLLQNSDSYALINNPEIPKEFELKNNYPNPFNPLTKIQFSIAKSTNTKISVFDILGKEVKVLLNTKLEPESYEISFDGSNFTSGVYFYRIETEFYTNTKRMILVK